MSPGPRVRPQRNNKSKNRASFLQTSQKMPWIGMHTSIHSKFLVNRNSSTVVSPLMSRAEYVTPIAMAGRVTPAKRGSAWIPRGCSSLTSSDAEHAADPRDDLLRAEHEADTHDARHRPSPRDFVEPRRGSECHHGDDRDGREDGQQVGTGSGGGGREGTGTGGCE